jgi:hypothetical protein
MDFDAMRGAMLAAVPTGDPGWVYLPGEASRVSRLLAAGDALSTALWGHPADGVDGLLLEWLDASAALRGAP